MEDLAGVLPEGASFAIDELGYVPFTKAGAELLFEVVSRAYERFSLIVTTNLPFEQWTEVLGSERLTGALLDAGSADPCAPATTAKRNGEAPRKVGHHSDRRPEAYTTVRR